MPQSRLASRFLTGLFHVGIFDRVLRTQRGMLAVVCYHRVTDRRDEIFQGYRPTISASVAGFEGQIDYLKKNFDPVSIGDLQAWLKGDSALPPRPALITFDDGYKDNGDIAWPVLRSRQVPAVVFLATDVLDTNRPFVWDYAAYVFYHTSCGDADIPLIGPTQLRTQVQRESAVESWIEALKARPDAEKWHLAERLSSALKIWPPDGAFDGLYLSWDGVRRLSNQGLVFGAHTRSHPILSAVPLFSAVAEIRHSAERLTSVLGSMPAGFAYPNGSAQDYGPEHERAVAEAGFTMGFSLHSGPTRIAAAAARPTAIERIYIGYDDNLPHFAAKLVGAARLKAGLRRQLRSRTHTGFAARGRG